MIIFPDLPDIQVEEVAVAEEITLTLRTISPTASCPSCGTVSSRIQSRYTRKLRDLPTVGRPIRLCCKKASAMVNSASIQEQQRSFFHEPAEPVQMASL